MKAGRVLIILAILLVGVRVRDNPVQRCRHVHGDMQPNLAHGGRVDAERDVFNLRPANRAERSLQGGSPDDLPPRDVATKARGSFFYRWKQSATLIWRWAGRPLRMPCTRPGRAIWRWI